MLFQLVVVLVFVSFVNCYLSLLLLLVLYYCRSGRFVCLLVIFWSFVIFLAVFVLLALVTNDRHLWILVVSVFPTF